MLKFSEDERYDMYMPNKISWISTSYEASKCVDNFHSGTMSFFPDGTSRKFRTGIQKQMWRASGQGIIVDTISVGKSYL